MRVATDFSIAGVGFRLDTPWPVPVTESFQPFWDVLRQADRTVFFEEADRLPACRGKEVFRNFFLAVYDCGGTYLRRYHSHTDADRPYAVTSCSRDGKTARVRYLAAERSRFSGSLACFSHIGFEELLMGKGRLILHAAAVDSPWGGILFSGPSGVGKSTQAALWAKYAGGTVLNGDRPILYRSEEGWLACGSPYAGSSRCHVNRCVPVRAIVMLEQGGFCRIRRLPAADAFARLYAGTVLNCWNRPYVETVCDLLTDLAASVPVYHMCCTPDAAAVETVKKALPEWGGSVSDGHFHNDILGNGGI